MPGLILQSSLPHPLQLRAWEAAIFGAMVGGFLGLVQFVLGLIRQRRDSRREQAKFGYQLLDALFDDESASELLYAVDAIGTAARSPRKRNTDLVADFVAIFRDGQQLAAGRTADVHAGLDAVLYHWDRFEHALVSELTRFEDIRMPTAYYVGLFSAYKPVISQYIANVQYSRVLAFLDRFDAWNTLPTPSPVRPDPPPVSSKR